MESVQEQKAVPQQQRPLADATAAATAEKRVKSTPQGSSRRVRMSPGVESMLPPADTPPPPPPTTSHEEGTPTLIVQKPTRKSLSEHVASTIHFLAGEVSARSGGPRSRSNASTASQASSARSEPPLTRARPPASPEDVDEQLDKILYAIGQLQQLQRRGRYIAAREVRNLRRAFLFAVGEEQLYREAVAAEERGKSVASAASSTPATPALRAKNTPQQQQLSVRGRRQQRRREEEKAAEQLSVAALAGEAGAVAETEVVLEDAATPTPTWLMKAAPTHADPAAAADADDVAAAPSTEPQGRRTAGLERAADYSPKATAADRQLAALEQYVDQRPTSSSFDVSGARFSWRSIVHTPGERRLQSLVMSLFIFFTGIPICLAISALLLMSRYTAPLMILYIIWIFTFGRPHHPHKKNRRFVRFFLWRYYRDYFPCRLVVPKAVRRKVDKERNYFFVYHPHGIHTFGALVNFGLDTNDLSEMLPGTTVHLQTLGVNLYIPFWRQLTIWMGCGDASAACLRKTLRSGPGQSIMLVVGGAEESLMAKPNANDLLLFKRKGFIKIALQEGTPLVPVYGFGENNVYNVSDLANEPDVQHLLGLFKRYVGFAIPLVKGRGFFNFSYGILPHRRPIVVVVGEPIEVPRIANPTSQDLDFWQARYIEGLQKLYDEHRGIYDLEATGLRIMR